jgi:ElaB/YqjD/DUF883 family membrane-anchored ribosome-binding protein
MSSTSERLGEQAKEAVEDVEKMGGTQCCGQAREEAHGVACHCEQFLRHKPLTSVLIAVGVGWLLGRFWKRG